jgi:hypothetical protein
MHLPEQFGAGAFEGWHEWHRGARHLTLATAITRFFAVY